MEIFDLSSILGHLAYIFLVIAFMLRNIVYLRLFSLLSSCIAIPYYGFFMKNPLFIDECWQIVFMLVNLSMLIVMGYEKYFVNFNHEEQKIYSRSFYFFSPLQFRKLIKNGTYIPFKSGDLLIKEHTHVENLLLICDGKTEIIREGKVIAYCTVGNIIGELSFLSGKTATADVKAIEDGLCLAWNQEKLRELLEKDEKLYANFQLTFTEELAKKIVTTHG